MLELEEAAPQQAEHGPDLPPEQQPVLPATGHDDPERLGPKVEEAKPHFVAFVIITSSLLFLAIFGLQIAGLVAAVRGYKKDDIQASWCSPMFSLFGVAEFDSNCIFREITGGPNKGLGCLELPGKRQRMWLMVTIVSLLLSLFLEALDFVTLCSPLGHCPFPPFLALELRRPWLTMTVGFATLVLILAIGANDAYTLPHGLSENIWLIVDSGEPFVCTGTLTPAGERGQFLGWLDGIFRSWGPVYFGPSRR